MNATGRAFGQVVRLAQGKPQMPEPVQEGNTLLSEDEKGAGVEAYRVETMRRLKLPDDMTWSAFLDRKQDEINPWVR
jgi:hypothetical protein